MTKTEIKIDQIVAVALLLNLERISSLEITLLWEDFLRKHPDCELETSSLTEKYVKFKDVISLKDNQLDTTAFKQRLEEIAGPCVVNHFKNFNFEQFLLEKVEHEGKIIPGDNDDIFCETERIELQKLVEKGYLTVDENNRIKLSELGINYWFKNKYVKEIEAFTEILRSLRYDPRILPDFFQTQDLDLPIEDILDIKRIDAFCREFNRSPLEPGASSLCYENLEEVSSMDDMLSVWVNRHCIYICHPNHIFAGSPLLTDDIREIRNVNWNAIDVQKMFNNNFGSFTNFDFNRAFDYVKSHVEQLKNTQDATTGYLAVVERYIFAYEDNYLVRGIIKKDENGYSVAFNPEYKKEVPKTFKEKRLMLTGEDIATMYCIRR